jgi:hypothetical protein
VKAVDKPVIDTTGYADVAGGAITGLEGVRGEVHPHKMIITMRRIIVAAREYFSMIHNVPPRKISIVLTSD